MSELWQLAAVDGAREIAAGRLSAADWMEAVLARIAEADPLIHAFVTLIPRAQLLNEARMATQRIRREGRRSPIDGAPLGLKDCIDVAGVTTTGSSRLFADAPPAAGDAPLVRRARDAGALIFGKQTLYELSYGGPSFDLPAPPARNPWNLAHIPGGSSSGSAAAVAAGCGLLAVGTDAGGSIRQPASFCGLVGLKPTGGAISTQGILPMSQTLGDAGPLARSIADASALFDALSGAATYAAVNQPLGSPRIAALDAFIAYAEPVVQQAIEHAMVALTKAGAVKTTLANPPDPLMLDSVGRTILLGEAYATHETQLQTNPSIYGAIARHRFSLGAFLSAADMIQVSASARG